MEPPADWLNENLGALIVVATACILYEMIRIRQTLQKLLDLMAESKRQSDYWAHRDQEMAKPPNERFVSRPPSKGQG